ncbi:MAG: efflux RND transporter periplasmic adaptor subunit [Planctomycetota bacterium]|nr:efflux RND transporter periplasmic adaptor subunit [Planctomycetota bacterium]
MRTPTIPLAAATALLVAGCGRSSSATDASLASTTRRLEPTRVRVMTVERREMRRVLSTTSVVESERQVTIMPRTSGVVIDLRVEEGDAVEAGAVLAVLDQRDARAALEETRLALVEAEDSVLRAALSQREAAAVAEGLRLSHEQAERQFERNARAGLISDQDLEQLAFDRDSALRAHTTGTRAAERAALDERAASTAASRARLACERAEVTLSHTEITAPFAGVIARRDLRVGDNAGPATEAFVLTDLGHLRAVFPRPQRELGVFAALGTDTDGEGAAHGDVRIRARAEAVPGYEFPGVIERISPSIDSASGSFRVTARLLPHADGTSLLPGMLLRLEVVLERHVDALVVPKRALRREGDVTVVFCVRDGAAHRVQVSPGFSEGDSVEVTPREAGTLMAGALVVEVGNRDLEDGAQVEVTDSADDRARTED